MFRFLKNLLSKTEAPPPATPDKPPQPPPAQPLARPAPAAQKPAEAPKPAPAAPAAAEVVQVGLKAVVDRLPEALKPLAGREPGDADKISIPRQKVLAQLPGGAVKISYAELRELAPKGMFGAGGDNDLTMVELPLAEILKALGPNALPQRTDQKKIEVPDEVGDLFGPRGKVITPPKAAVIGVAPVEKPAAAAPPPAAKPAAPAPAPAPELPKPAAPAAAPAPAPVKPAPATQPAQAPKPAAPAPAAPKPAAPAPAIPFPSAPQKPAPAPAAVGDAVPVPLDKVSEAWPDAIKQEIQSLKLAGAQIMVPVEELGRGLKMGKVAFSWSQICAWATPAPSGAPAQGNTALEMPLKVVAPLFVPYSKKLIGAQKAVVVDSSIPDMFGGKAGAAAAPAVPKPAAPTPPAAPPPAPPPPAAPAAPVTPAPVIQKPAVPVTPTPTAAPAPAPMAARPQTLGEVFNQPAKTRWTLPEIVKGVAGLPGVSGALLTLQDGMLVKAEMPATVNASALAGFVPEIHGRLNKYAQDAGLGEVSVVQFTARDVQWLIGHSGKLFLAVRGKPDEPLPVDALNAVMMELGKQH